MGPAETRGPRRSSSARRFPLCLPSCPPALLPLPAHASPAMAQLSNRTLKYISSISFAINPLSSSRATRSMRLLLSNLPTKPPTGQNTFPQTSLSTAASDKEQVVHVTYSDKKKISIVPDELSLPNLIRKVCVRTKACSETLRSYAQHWLPG